MKLKNITLGALFVFIAFFATLAFLPTDTKFLSFSNYSNSTDVNNVDPLNTDPNTNPDNTPKTVLTTIEVSKHNTVNDCYLIVKGSVYSMATFVDKHPGGRQKILDMCGKEASSIFSAIHSNFAWNLLKDFYIGTVGSAQVSAGVTTTTELNNILNKNNFSGRSEKDEDESEFEED